MCHQFLHFAARAASLERSLLSSSLPFPLSIYCPNKELPKYPDMSLGNVQGGFTPEKHLSLDPRLLMYGKTASSFSVRSSKKGDQSCHKNQSLTLDQQNL